MFKTSLTYLDLRSPLQYIPVKSADLSKSDEILLCYEINMTQNSSIEPVREQFLGSLVFIGEKADEKSAKQGENDEAVLPAGSYLFNQCRAADRLNQDEWLDIAIEQQKDGLWERNKLRNMLYVRFLYEDDAMVTQVFRPVESNQA